MICTSFFQGQAGDKFGLRVVSIDNVVSCTAEVTKANDNGTGEVGRFGLDELRSGDVMWELEAGTTYLIVMSAQSKIPGQEVTVEVEIPLGDPSSSCSRTSSGLIGNWQVDVE